MEEKDRRERGRKKGEEKEGKERFFTKKQDFANFCWDYIKEYWKKRSIFAT